MTQATGRAPTWRGVFSRQVYEILRSVPAGRLATYGQIAERIPTPDGMDPLAFRRIRARWVGYVLADCPDDLPWHRVVNRHGQISRRHGHGPHVQPMLLEQEGVVSSAKGAFDLEQYGWDPEGDRRDAQPSTDGEWSL